MLPSPSQLLKHARWSWWTRPGVLGSRPLKRQLSSVHASPPSLFWLVNRKEGQPGSTAATPSWGAALPTFPYSLISLDVRAMLHVLWSSPWLTYRLLLCLFCPVKLGRAGRALSSLRSKLRTRHLAGDRGSTGLSREPHRFKCRTADSALTSNSCLPFFWAPGWTGNTFRLQFSAAQTNASYPKRLLWLGTRFTVRSWVDNQHCYFKALRTASSFMTTARSPFTFSRPLM